MRMHLAGWACVLVAGVALAADKPKKDKPTTTPPPTGAVVGPIGGGLVGGLVGIDADRGDTKFTISKPVGTWVREADVSNATCRLVLTVTDDRLTLKVDLKNGHQTSALRLDADYAINKESCLFGVIDSCDATSSHTNDTSELAKVSGQPFSVRFRAEGDGLTLKDFKGFGVGMVETASKEMAPVLAVLCGRYTKVDPSKPLPALKAVEHNSDPLIRQDQLLNQSESFGQPGSTNHTPPRPADPPSHVTPTRIHGGILKADPPKEGTRLGGVPYPTPHYLKHYPTYFAPDPVSPNDKERDKPLDPTGELKQANAEEPAKDAPRCEPPTDAEVMEVFNARRKKELDDKKLELQEDVTIVKNLVKDKIDPPQAYPVLGVAQLHHCQWECGVYYNDVKQISDSYPTSIRKPKVEVILLDADCLQVIPAKDAVVPQRMPEK
jgi:hypothetical protein